MQYRQWNFVYTVVALIVFVVFLILACSVGAEELKLPKHGTLPIDRSMSVSIGDTLLPADSALPAMLDSDENQLTHENSLAIIDTAMHLGEVCVLLQVTLHAKLHNKPITLKELSKQSDACVAKHLKMLERK